MKLVDGHRVAAPATRALSTPIFRTSRMRNAQASLISLLYLAPSLIVFGIFVFYPLIKSIYLSLYASSPFGFATGIYVGPTQYRTALGSTSYRQGLVVTLLYTLYTVPLGILIALALATLANVRVRGIGFFRTIYALPIGVSVGASSIVFLLLYNSRAGVINYFLSSLNLPAIEWLTQPRAALWAVAILSIWGGIGLISSSSSAVFRASRRSCTRARGSTGPIAGASSAASPYRC